MSMPAARELILAKLRAAAPERPPAFLEAATLQQNIDRHFATRRSTAGTAARVLQMQTALQAAHAEVWLSDEASWPDLLAEKLAHAGVRNILLDARRPQGAALEAVLPPNIASLHFKQPIEAWKSQLFDSVDAGFTVARSGIADTGTLVIAPDAGTPRTVSLAPPLHVALVYADTLHADLHAAVQAEQWAGNMPGNLVLVSGPSKTSDIQQTLAYGAHGPRWLWVIIVTPEAQS